MLQDTLGAISFHSGLLSWLERGESNHSAVSCLEWLRERLESR